jgi:hypothetical protein
MPSPKPKPQAESNPQRTPEEYATLKKITPHFSQTLAKSDMAAYIIQKLKEQP